MSLAQNTKSQANKPQTSETKAKVAGIVAGNIQSWHHPPSCPKRNAVPFSPKKSVPFKKRFNCKTSFEENNNNKENVCVPESAKKLHFTFTKGDATASFTIDL